MPGREQKRVSTHAWPRTSSLVAAADTGPQLPLPITPGSKEKSDRQPREGRWHGQSFARAAVKSRFAVTR
jgi:hypothetical protein